MGKFISIEGGDGTGKTTQIKMLAEALTAKHMRVMTTREPGGSPGAEEIRHMIVTGEANRWDGICEALLLFAARRDHVIRTIKPALEDGKWVISDRFADSTTAYQGYGYNQDLETLKQLHQIAIGDFQPDLTIILDIEPELGIERAMGRGVANDRETRYESMKLPFHHRLRDGFLQIAKDNPDRCVVVDASRSVEDVHAEILKAVNTRLRAQAA